MPFPGLVPILFFMPLWLGYATLSYTSAGPSGGVLYPWLLIWFRDPSAMTALDIRILQCLPQVLEPFSQTPGPMMSLSGGGGVGPIAALKMGLGIAIFTLGVGYLHRHGVPQWIHALVWLPGLSPIRRDGNSPS